MFEERVLVEVCRLEVADLRAHCLPFAPHLHHAPQQLQGAGLTMNHALLQGKLCHLGGRADLIGDDFFE